MLDPSGMSCTLIIHDCITQAISATVSDRVCTCIKVEPRKGKNKERKLTRYNKELGQKVKK